MRLFVDGIAQQFHCVFFHAGDIASRYPQPVGDLVLRMLPAIKQAVTQFEYQPLAGRETVEHAAYPFQRDAPDYFVFQ